MCINCSLRSFELSFLSELAINPMPRKISAPTPKPTEYTMNLGGIFVLCFRVL